MNKLFNFSKCYLFYFFPINKVSGSIFRTSGNLCVTQYTTNTHSQILRAVYHPVSILQFANT